MQCIGKGCIAPAAGEKYMNKLSTLLSTILSPDLSRANCDNIGGTLCCVNALRNKVETTISTAVRSKEIPQAFVDSLSLDYRIWYARTASWTESSKGMDIFCEIEYKFESGKARRKKWTQAIQVGCYGLYRTSVNCPDNATGKGFTFRHAICILQPGSSSYNPLSAIKEHVSYPSIAETIIVDQALVSSSEMVCKSYQA